METKYKTYSILEVFLFLIALASIQAGNLQAEETDLKEYSRIAWLKQHAIPLRSIDPNDEDFIDLEPLAKIFENVRIVQLAVWTTWPRWHSQRVVLSKAEGTGALLKTRRIVVKHSHDGWTNIRGQSSN